MCWILGCKALVSLAQLPGTGELCRVISQKSTHLSDEGKALSVRFQGLLNKTKGQVCDPKFHPLALGTLHCSKFFRDDEKSISRAQMLGRIQTATDAMAVAGAGAGVGAGVGVGVGDGAGADARDWVEAMEFAPGWVGGSNGVCPRG